MVGETHRTLESPARQSGRPFAATRPAFDFVRRCCEGRWREGLLRDTRGARPGTIGSRIPGLVPSGCSGAREAHLMSKAEKVSILVTISTTALGVGIAIVWPNVKVLGWVLIGIGGVGLLGTLASPYRERGPAPPEMALFQDPNDGVAANDTGRILGIGNVDSDLDPVISIDCVDGREAVLVVTSDRPTKLTAQAKLMTVPHGEVERGDPYRVAWRVPSTGGYTTQFQDLRQGKTATIVLGRAFHPVTYMTRTSVYLEVTGEAAVIQRIEKPWPSDAAMAEVSVNIFGGKAGHLVHGHHYLLTAKRGSKVVTVRPLQGEQVTSAPAGVVLSNNMKPRTT